LNWIYPGGELKKLLLILLLAATVAHAETYKWIDSEGTVHFSDSLGEIPANYRNSANPLDMNKTPDNKSGLRQDSGASRDESGQNGTDQSGIPSQVEGMKERMMKDEGIMALIRALQDDPEMKALLDDPAMMSALQAGDIGALINSPAFLKILNNPRVREIEKRVNSQGIGTK
jgi:hypothetical protein